MTQSGRREFRFDDPDWAAAFDELSYWSSRFGTLLLDNLSFEPGVRALDVGCATGFPLFELAHRHGPGCSFVGLDVWGVALRRAALKRRLHGDAQLGLVRGDAASLPFRGDSFDLVVSNLGINNFENPRACLLECARVLRPGGRLVLTTNPMGHVAEFYAELRALLRERGEGEAATRVEQQERHRGSEAELVDLLKATGFAVRRVVRDSFVLRYLDGDALLEHHLTRIGFLDGWRKAIGDGADEVLEALAQRLDEQARATGELSLSVPMLYLESTCE